MAQAVGLESRIHMRSMLLLGWALIVSPSMGWAAEFTALGDLPGGTYMSAATGISHIGRDVVGYSISQPPGSPTEKFEAFVWRADTGMVGLGYGEGGSPTWANDVSWLGGTVIGGSSAPESSAVFWQHNPGGWSPTVIPTSGSTAAEALGISDYRGNAMVGWAKVDGHKQAFRYEFPVGLLPSQFEWLTMGEPDSEACDVTKGPMYDPYVSVGTSGGMPTRWVDAGRQELPLPPGATGGGLIGITPDEKTMIGWATFPIGSNEVDLAVRYAIGPPMAVQVLSYDGSSRPLDVTPDGRTIVGSIDWGGGSRAFVWKSDHSVQPLQDILQYEQGLDLSGWTLQCASGVTPDGLIIVGTGINPTGNTEAWRVILDSRAEHDIDNPGGEELTLDEELTLPVNGRSVEVSTTVTSSGLLSVSQVPPLPGAPPIDEDYLVAGIYPQLWSIEISAEHGPVTLTFHYDPTGLMDVDEDLLCIYHWKPELLEWLPEDSIIDVDFQTITTTVEDLSLFSLGVIPEPASLSLVALGWLLLLYRRRTP